MYEFIKDNHKPSKKSELTRSDKLFLSLTQRYLKEGGEAMEKMLFRTALDKLFMQLQRILKEYISRGEINQQILNDFFNIQVRVISPFMPYITEELWHSMGNKGYISLAEWPKADLSKINSELEKDEVKLEKVIEDIRNIIKLLKEREKKDATRAYLYVLPPEKKYYLELKEVMSRKLGMFVEVYAVNDKKKYDPSSKASKAKPERPSIYLE